MYSWNRNTKATMLDTRPIKADGYECGMMSHRVRSNFPRVLERTLEKPMDHDRAMFSS